jgi:hypothetical protein
MGSVSGIFAVRHLGCEPGSDQINCKNLGVDNIFYLVAAPPSLGDIAGAHNQD